MNWSGCFATFRSGLGVYGLSRCPAATPGFVSAAIGRATTEDMTVRGVLQDLVEEQEALDAVVAPATVEQWVRETPSPGWSVGDQIGHLAYFDGTAALAITDREAFEAHRRELVRSMSDDAAEDATLGSSRALRHLTCWPRGAGTATRSPRPPAA